MKPNEIKQQIILIAIEISKSNDDYEKELLKTYLDYYVDLAIKNYK